MTDLNSTRTRITASVNDKSQQRTLGRRIKRNFLGHFNNTIAAKIDNMIQNDNFTKKQIVAFSGTKMSRVNAHINHLRKTKKMDVVINNDSKIVSFK